MARPRNNDERRGQLITALQKVMAGQGYEKASVAAIGREAGLTPGLVHYHFRRKQEILLALLERLAEGVQRRYRRRVSAASSPWERLDAWVDAHVALGEDADPDAVACWVAIGAEALRQPEVREAYVRAAGRDLDQCAELVGAVLGTAGKRTDRARELAAGLLAAVEGAYQLACAAPGVVPAGFAAPAIRSMARGLVAGEVAR